MLVGLFIVFGGVLSSHFAAGEVVQTSAIQVSSSAKAMCLIEQSSGRVLYGKNYDKKLPMASTTKIFTALTVLENCDNLSEVVEVDDRAVGIEGTSIYLRYGEKLTVRELLLGMMLPSGNDAATALGYHIGGSLPAFCELMQKTAENAGCLNSSFKNPHGLDEDGHYTTAYDLAKIAAKALENKDFMEISTTKAATISGNKEVKTRYLRNKNRLLTSFEGCNGVKTGFTDNAGRCFVSSAERNGMTVVCSVLNCGPMFEECARFMNMAFENYHMTELLPSYKIIDKLAVKKGRESEVKVFTRKDFSYPLSKDEALRINYVTELPDSLTAPVEKEAKVGAIKIYLDENLLFEEEIFTQDFVEKESVMAHLRDISRLWR